MTSKFQQIRLISWGNVVKTLFQYFYGTIRIVNKVQKPVFRWHICCAFLGLCTACWFCQVWLFISKSFIQYRNIKLNILLNIVLIISAVSQATSLAKVSKDKGKTEISQIIFSAFTFASATPFAYETCLLVIAILILDYYWFLLQHLIQLSALTLNRPMIFWHMHVQGEPLTPTGIAKTQTFSPTTVTTAVLGTLKG